MSFNSEDVTVTTWRFYRNAAGFLGFVCLFAYCGVLLARGPAPGAVMLIAMVMLSSLLTSIRSGKRLWLLRRMRKAQRRGGAAGFLQNASFTREREGRVVNSDPQSVTVWQVYKSAAGFFGFACLFVYCGILLVRGPAPGAAMFIAIGMLFTMVASIRSGKRLRLLRRLRTAQHR